MISIIIPICNRLNLIEETLQSIKLQVDTHYQSVIVNDGSINNTIEKTISLIKSVSLSRFNMLSQLGFEFSEAEKQAYIKQFSFTERLNFEELKALIQLNNKALKSNNTGLFDAEKLKIVIEKFQSEAVNQYFKSSAKYNPKYIGQFAKTSRLANTKFSFLEKVKLYIKAITFFKNHKL